MRAVKVFLSHAAEDRDLVRELTAGLAAAGHEVWSPDLNLFPGDNWGLEVGKALEKADALVVLISPEAVASPWFAREIEYALGSKRFENRLLPVVVRPTDDIPWILRRFQMVTGEGDAAAIVDRVSERLATTSDASPRAQAR